MNPSIDAFLRPIQLWSIRNKPWLLQLSFLAYIGLVGLYIVGLPLFLTFPKQFGLFLELGSKFGVISLGLYGLTLLPGILKRLQILPVIQVTMMLFRRQFGILMFLTAINHSGFSTLFPMFATNSFSPGLLSTREILGTVAEMVLFPLFITSNDFSQRTLGTWWKILHKLTYVALLLIFGHVALLSGELELKLLTGILLGLEVISWFVYWWRSRQYQGKASVSEQSIPPSLLNPQV